MAKTPWQDRHIGYKPELVPVFKRCVYWAGLIGEYGDLAVNIIRTVKPEVEQNLLTGKGFLPEVLILYIGTKLNLPFNQAAFISQMGILLRAVRGDASGLFPITPDDDGYDFLEVIGPYAYLHELSTTCWGNALLRLLCPQETSLLHQNLAEQDFFNQEATTQTFCKLPIFLQPTRCLLCANIIIQGLNIDRIFKAQEVRKIYCDECFSERESDKKRLQAVIKASILGLDRSASELVGFGVLEDRDVTEEARTIVTLTAYADLIKLQKHPYEAKYQLVSAYKSIDTKWLEDIYFGLPIDLTKISIFKDKKIDGKLIITKRISGRALRENELYLDQLPQFFNPRPISAN